jgi:hypothetical protein
MYIFALLPFSKISTTCDVNWHLVIFNKWIDIGRKLPEKYFTYLCYDSADNYFTFKCKWLKYNKEDSFAKHWQAFWALIEYKRGFYIADEWVWFNRSDINYDDVKYYEELSDEYNTSFKLIEGEERITVNVTIKGEGRKYAPRILKFNWLKDIYCNIFKTHTEDVNISFSTDIGPDRGTWKGGIVSSWYPFIINLMLSWVDFKSQKLGEILNGQKFI